MTKKNDKRLCWNCEGNVSQHLENCPYCGVNVASPKENSAFQGFASPFQSAPGPEIPQPPYARDFTVTKDEWNSALNEDPPKEKEEEAHPPLSTKRDMVALLLLMPGIIFFLFGMTLIFFSSDGILTLQWNQNVAYFYFLGAAPLIYLGWRAIRS